MKWHLSPRLSILEAPLWIVRDVQKPNPVFLPNVTALKVCKLLKPISAEEPHQCSQNSASRITSAAAVEPNPPRYESVWAPAASGGLAGDKSGCVFRRLAAQWLGDLDSNQGCPGQSREFYR